MNVNEVSFSLFKALCICLVVVESVYIGICMLKTVMSVLNTFHTLIKLLECIKRLFFVYSTCISWKLWSLIGG